MYEWLLYFLALLTPNTVPQKDYVGEIAAEAAYSALLSDKEPVKPLVDPKDCKKCNGTGRVRSGDGLGWEKCPDCQPPESAAEKAAAEKAAADKKAAEEKAAADKAAADKAAADKAAAAKVAVPTPAKPVQSSERVVLPRSYEVISPEPSTIRYGTPRYRFR